MYAFRTSDDATQPGAAAQDVRGEGEGEGEAQEKVQEYPARVLGRDAARDVQPAVRQPLERRHAHLC